MKISKETRVYIFISERPGNFGLRFHNEGFESLRINATYLPLKARPNQLESVILTVNYPKNSSIKNWRKC